MRLVDIGNVRPDAVDEVGGQRRVIDGHTVDEATAHRDRLVAEKNHFHRRREPAFDVADVVNEVRAGQKRRKYAEEALRRRLTVEDL